MTTNTPANFSDIDRAVERFLNGEMPEEERKQFREFLVKNSEASELLSAERLIQKVSAKSAFVPSTQSIGPSPLLLTYFSESRPVRNGIRFGFLGLFALMLGILIYLTWNFHSSNMPPGAVTSLKAIDTVSVTASHTDSVAPERKVTVPLETKLKSAPTASGSVQPPQATAHKPISHNFDEQVGEPPTYIKDKGGITIHSK